jgi:hypothetical protein
MSRGGTKNMAKTAGPAEKIVEAITESSNALLEAARSANERGFRISKTVLEEAERGQQDALDLGRKFAKEPTDLSGFSSAVVEKTNEAQGRVVELFRQWFSELSDAGQETRDTFGKVVKANREVAQASFEGVRTLFGRGVENVQEAVENAASWRSDERPARRAREVSA